MEDKDYRLDRRERTTAMANMAGVHGYSSPCPDHVIFSVDEGMYGILSQSEAWAGLVAEHLEVGIGCWKGKEETCFALPQEVFDEMLRRWPWIMHDQESILVLGTPESQNWRPAKEVSMQHDSGWREEDLGTWIEVTEAEARKQDGWSCFNGHWFTCLDDPPDSVGTAEERLLEAKAAALDKIMGVMNENYDWNTKSEPQAIADMIASRMEQANAAKAKAHLCDMVMPKIATMGAGDMDRFGVLPYFAEWSRL